MESKRIRGNPCLNLGVITLLILFAFLSLLGTFDYLSLSQDVIFFKKYEKEKIGYYLNMDQYGGYGFKVQTKFSPLLLFFSSSPKYSLESNIDNKETIIVNSSRRGKAQFRSDDFFSPWGVVLFFGVLLLLYSGLSTFSSRLHIELFGGWKGILLTILARLILVVSYLFYLILVPLLIPVVLGVRFPLIELGLYSLYFMYFLGLATFIFILGIIVRLFILDKKNNAVRLIMVIWLFNLAVPFMINKYIGYKANRLDSIYELNLKKLKQAKGFEDEASNTFIQLLKENIEKVSIYRIIIPKYLRVIYPSNIKLEEQYIQEVLSLIEHKENICSYFPSAYFPFLGKEISGDGHMNYIDLLNVIIQKKGAFLEHYFHNKYFTKDKTVNPFMSDNVFPAIAQLPPTFFPAFLILLIYVSLAVTVLLSLLYRLLRIDSKPQGNVRIKAKTFNFILIENPKERRERFRLHKKTLPLSCIDKIDPQDIAAWGLGFFDLLEYFCLIRNLGKQDCALYLEILKVKAKEVACQVTVPGETIKKIYLASCVGRPNLLLINDFIKNESLEFDLYFSTLLQYLIEVEGKSVLYYGSEPYSSKKKTNLYSEKQRGRICEVDYNYISLR